MPPPPSALCTPHSALRTGFTLLELLVVIAIVGILAALAVPTMRSFNPNVTATAERQLLDDLARARQLAISQRTTVALMFVPSNFWGQTPYQKALSLPVENSRGSNLFDKQMIGYTLVSLRSVGDQPGESTKRYLSAWKTLPEGTFIPPAKFGDFNPLMPVADIYTNGLPTPAFRIYGFQRTNNIPFPSEDTPIFSDTAPYVMAPYVAFDYMGRLTSGRDEIIPLAKGAVGFSRDPITKQAVAGIPFFTESPASNFIKSFTLVHVDWLTGRAHIEHQSIQ